MSADGGDYPFCQYAKVAKIKDHVGNAIDIAMSEPASGNHFIMVADRRQGCIKQFDVETGKFHQTLVSGVAPQGVAMDSSYVAFTDSKEGKTKCVRVVDPRNGKELAQIGSQRKHWRPFGIHLNKIGEILVTDCSKRGSAVHVFKRDGTFFGSHCNQGIRARLNKPCYITSDVYNRIIVSDAGSHCVKVYSPQWNLLNIIGEYGSGPGQFDYPRGVATDSLGNIMVCDAGNKRVSVFSACGRYIGNVLTKDEHYLAHPYGIAFTMSGKMAVCQNDYKTNGVFKKVSLIDVYYDIDD